MEKFESLVSKVQTAQSEYFELKLIMSALNETCDSDLLKADLEFKVDTVIFKDSEVENDFVKLGFDPKALDPELEECEKRELKKAVEGTLDKMLDRVTSVSSAIVQSPPENNDHLWIKHELKRLEEGLKKVKLQEQTLVDMKANQQYQVVKKAVRNLSAGVDNLDAAIREVEEAFQKESGTRTKEALNVVSAALKEQAKQSAAWVEALEARLGEYRELDQEKFADLFKKYKRVKKRIVKLTWLLETMNNFDG